MIKSGSNFNIAKTAHGEVYSWGYNIYGQLGIGHNNNQNIPQLVDFFKDKKIKKIICGGDHTFAITDINDIYSWGYNEYGQLGLGYNHNIYHHYYDQNIPQQVEFFKDKQIIKIKCGVDHTIVITNNDEVYSWGGNFYGQLGLGHNNNQNIPQQINFFKDKQIKKIICGGYHTIAITEIGEVYSWGNNCHGQLGFGCCSSDKFVPQQVEFFKNKQIKEIICGRDHTIAITESGDVYSWGDNEFGQLGLGNYDNQNGPQQVDFLKDKQSRMLQQANLQIKKIICGNYHTFAITEIGDIYSWGLNNRGQLGLGHNNNQNIPQQVDFFKDKQIKEIICGKAHTFAITEIGEVYSWGNNLCDEFESGFAYSGWNNLSGQLGLGNYNNQNIPQLVEFFKEHPIFTIISKLKSARSAIRN